MHLRGFGFLVSVLVSIGCSPTDSDETRSVSPGEVEELGDFVGRLAAAVCEFGIKCSNQPLRYGPLEQCREELRIDFESSSDLASPNVQYDPAKGANCLNALVGSSCESTIEFLSGLSVHCSQVVQGTLDSDEACGSSAECKPDLWCDQAECPGTCKPLPRQGEPCPNYACASGFGCVDKAGDELGALEPTCEPLAGEGAACGSGIRDCELGLTCAGEGPELLCLPFSDAYPDAGLGEACRSDSQCGSANYCAGSSDGGVCVKRSALGAACDVAHPSPCASDGYCQRSGDAAICAPRVAFGEACTATNECTTGACISGTCQFQRANGEACNDAEECYSHACIAGKCEPEPECVPLPSAPASMPFMPAMP